MGKDDDPERFKSGTVGTFVLTVILLVAITVINTVCVLVSLGKYYTHEWQKKRAQKMKSGHINVDIVAWCFLCLSFIFQIFNMLTLFLERFQAVSVTENYCWGILYVKFSLHWGLLPALLFLFWWVRLHYVFRSTAYGLSKARFRGFIAFLAFIVFLLQVIWISRYVLSSLDSLDSLDFLSFLDAIILFFVCVSVSLCLCVSVPLCLCASLCVLLS